MKVFISGKEMADGLEKVDCGTFAVKSSSTLVRSEKAGRTGYSWSVTMIAIDQESISPYSRCDDGQSKSTGKLLCPTPVIDVRSVVVLLDALTLPLRRTLDHCP